MLKDRKTFIENDRHTLIKAFRNQQNTFYDDQS